MYDTAYFPMAIVIWLLGLIGRLPRVMPSTKGEGHERRYFYGTVWAMCIAQPILWFLYLLLPKNHITDIIKLVVFTSVLALVGYLSYRGLLPRTRRIVPGEIAALD